MQTFLKIFGVFIGIVVLVGIFLDNRVDVSRSVMINAKPAEIHPYVSDLQRWPDWTTWQEMDPTIKTTIGSISEGVGASQSWIGESGGGALTITQSSLDEGVVFQLTFDGDDSVYQSALSYSPKGDSTEVTWRMTGTMGPIIIGNYFAQLMDMFVGPAYQQGLDNLKAKVEGQSL